eukprot:6492227-Amphidinium_carterae.2
MDRSPLFDACPAKRPAQSLTAPVATTRLTYAAALRSMQHLNTHNRTRADNSVCETGTIESHNVIETSSGWKHRKFTRRTV